MNVLPLALVMAALLALACTQGRQGPHGGWRDLSPGPPPPDHEVAARRAERAGERLQMVRAQLEERGIDDPRVLQAMTDVPRHHFVPPAFASAAYQDTPLPIGAGQTISQPYVVALMTEAAHVQPGERVLDIGTGSGYQAAVLAEIAEDVYTIEIVPELARDARAALDRVGYRHVHSRVGDGYRGWPEQAPFDAILVAAAPDHVPPALLEQLAPGGRLVLPVENSEGDQILELHEKHPDGTLTRRALTLVRFVPMKGAKQASPP